MREALTLTDTLGDTDNRDREALLLLDAARVAERDVETEDDAPTPLDVPDREGDAVRDFVVDAVCDVDAAREAEIDAVADGDTAPAPGEPDREADTARDFDVDAETEGDAEHAAPPAPAQPQTVTPSPGLGAPVPSPRAVRTVSVTAAGAPSARVTSRRPALVMFSSASTVSPSSGRDVLAVREPIYVPGSPCTRRLAAREPQSTNTVPGAPAVSTPFKADGAVHAEPTPPTAFSNSFQSDHAADGYACASQSTAIRPPPPPPPCGNALLDMPPGPPCTVTEPTEYPSTLARSNTLPPLPPPPPSKQSP